MTPNVDTIFDAALKLPADQRLELMNRLEKQSHDDRKRNTGNVRKYFGAFDSGDPKSADNDKIDEDLAAEYLDTHESEN
jgi:hypothetical protein